MSDSPNRSAQTRWQQFLEWLLYSQVSTKSLLRQAQLTAGAIALIEALLLIVLIATATVFSSRAGQSVVRDISFVVVSLLALYIINRRGFVKLAGISLSVVLLGIALSIVARTGPLTPNTVMLVIPVIVAGLFGTPLSAVIIAILAGIGYLAINIQFDAGYVAGLAQGENLLQTALVYASLVFVSTVSWLFSRVTHSALEESHELSLALVEQRQDLEKRLTLQTRQLQATTAVARAVAGMRDLNRLLEDIVRLVRESFGYYHVQVFLVDEDQNYAVLHQSTGEVGQQLLEQGHRLPVGSLSVIGQVTASGRSVIASDTDADMVHRRNELLPHTRAEVAIPLMLGERVIGALDMQSVEANAFDEEMLPTFQALADQLAVAIENARLFEQAERSLREFSDLSGEITQRSWTEFLSEAREEERYQVYGPEPKALAVHRSRVVERVLGAGSIVVSTGKDGRQSFIAAPIVVRNEVIGVLGVEPDGHREWTQDELQMLQSISDRTALAVENARLYMQAQRAATRERLIGDITSRLQRAPSLALLLESATKELAQALGTENVYAEISLDQPLAQSRKSVSESDDVKEVDGEATDTRDKASDEPEGARAER